MISRKFEVDTCIRFPGHLLMQNSQPGPGTSFRPDPVTLLHIDPSIGKGTAKTSDVAANHLALRDRNFQWLTYSPGYISHVPLMHDVLTGPMSGCRLVVFRLNGVVQSGHLGTVSGYDDVNTAINQTWGNWAQAHQADVIVGFNPLRDWAGTIPPQNGKIDGSNPSLFGLITAGHNHLYTIWTYPVLNSPNTMRIY